MTVNTRLAFVFPGQGSQQVGMLADLAEKWPLVKEIFGTASEALGYDLWRLVQGGPQEQLNLTEHAQPALLTSSYAIWSIWKKVCSARPALMAGHSLGEWSALVCSEVVRFEDAVRLVQLRGRYMQQAVPVGVGAMAAIIGLTDEAVLECCKRAAGQEEVNAVNFNSPGQVVIAGHAQAVERAMSLCKEAGAKRALLLPVSAPFHTGLMKPAADQLATHIESTAFHSPATPVIHNVNAQTETAPEAIKQLMIEQIYRPVLWVDCVGAMATKGIVQAVECGPGKVLAGLVKRIDKNIETFNTDSASALEQTLQSLS